MARNKYPEETVHKILDAAYHLFAQKGYDKTTIADIVMETGMSKGAIYHHFKGKEDILEAISDTYSGNGKESFVLEISRDKSLNGLEKMRRIYEFALSDEKKIMLDKITFPVLFREPRLFFQLFEETFQNSSVISSIIEEGNRDGSLQVDHPKETAEVLLLLTNFWLSPLNHPYFSEADFHNRLSVFQKLLEQQGLPIITDTIKSKAEQYLKNTMAVIHQIQI